MYMISKLCASYYIRLLNPNCGLTLKAIELNNLHFYPLEVVSRYRDQQLQVGEIYSYSFNCSPNIRKS